MDSTQTIYSIDKVLDPFLIKTKFKNNAVIMDNAAPHTAKSVCEFMESQGIEYMKFGGGKRPTKGGFPPNSPDLNPIENIFGILQHRVNVERPTTMKSLIEVVEKCWNEIPLNHVRSTIRSLKKRMQYVLEHNGAYSM